MTDLPETIWKYYSKAIWFIACLGGFIGFTIWGAIAVISPFILLVWMIGD